MAPLLTVIIPIYNSIQYLENTLNSVLYQDIEDIEILCIDDGSTDGSLQFLKEYAQKDPRIKVIEQNHGGAGAARNKGIENAHGKYVHFLDSDDWLVKGAYRLVIDLMERSGVEVCVFQRFLCDTQNNDYSTRSIRAFPMDKYVSNFESDPIFFLRSPVVPWNKIIRKTVIDEHKLRYDELICANDRTFYLSLVKNAKSIMVSKECLIFHRINNSKSLVGTTRLANYDCHFKAYRSTRKVFEGSTKEIKMAVDDISFTDMLNFFEKADPYYLNKIYQQLHEFLQEVDLRDYYGKSKKYVWAGKFNFIKKHKFGLPLFIGYNYKENLRRKINRNPSTSKKTYKKEINGLIVSFTTYPERTEYVPQVFDSILKQTYKPEKVILWISKEEYDENNLDRRLVECKKKGLEIRFVKGNLKSHKKYFYAVQEYKDHCILTIDDDIVYENDMIEKIWNTHEKFPKAVVGTRVHKIAVSNNSIGKYQEWSQNDYTLYHKPSMLGMATGAGGILYPPGSLPEHTFDKEHILEMCDCGDDIWLKFMEMMNGVPTVAADIDLSLKYAKGSQDSALWRENIDGGKNDKTIQKILEYIKSEKNFDAMKLFYDKNIVELNQIGLIIDCTKSPNSEKIIELINNLRSGVKLICYDLTDNHTEKLLLERAEPNEYVIIKPLKESKLPLNIILEFSGCSRFIYTDIDRITDMDTYMDCIESLLDKKDKVITSKSLHRLYGIEENPEDIDLLCTSIDSKLVIDSKLQHLDDVFSRKMIRLLDSKEENKVLVSDKLEHRLYNSESLYNMRYLIDCKGITLKMPKDPMTDYICNPSKYKLCSFDSKSVYPAYPLGFIPKRCPICKSVVNHFETEGSYVRDNVVCPECKSFERHRAMSFISSRILKPTAGTESDKEWFRKKSIYYIGYPREAKQSLNKMNVKSIGLDRINEMENVDLLNICHVILDKKTLKNVLETIKDKMNPNGYLLISVPIEKRNKEQPRATGINMDIYKMCEFIDGYGFKTEVELVNTLLPLDRITYYSLYQKETLLIAKFKGQTRDKEETQ